MNVRMFFLFSLCLLTSQLLRASELTQMESEILSLSDIDKSQPQIFRKAQRIATYPCAHNTLVSPENNGYLHTSAKRNNNVYDEHGNQDVSSVASSPSKVTFSSPIISQSIKSPFVMSCGSEKKSKSRTTSRERNYIFIKHPDYGTWHHSSFARMTTPKCCDCCIVSSDASCITKMLACILPCYS